MAPAKYRACHTILDLSWEMRLIDNGQNIVGSFNTQRSEASVLHDEDPIIRIAYDCSLVLRHLNNYQPKELYNGVGD